MSYADKVYRDLVHNVQVNGEWDYGEAVRTRYEDGIVAHSKSIFGVQVKFPKGTLPIISTKKLFTETAKKEMILFWVKQTVKKEDFDAWNVKIWNQWFLEDGTLGKSYASQFQKGDRNQVVDLLTDIVKTPKSRRLMTSFWDYESAQDKALQECAWATQWDVRGGYLNLILIQRSVDVACGLPFNWLQYYQLQCLVAHCTGLKVGDFTHQMGNVHYYDRHEDLLLEQVRSDVYHNTNAKVLIDSNLINFFDTQPEDVQLVDFKCSKKVYKYDIAV